MLTAAELALIALEPSSGRHRLGLRSNLNACLAGLLVADCHLEPTADRSAADDALLAQVAEIAEQRGPKTKRVLSAMDRELRRRTRSGTWDAVVATLLDHRAVTRHVRLGRARHVPDLGRRTLVVERLRAAAAGSEPLDPRDAILIALLPSARLDRVVARSRAERALLRTSAQQALDTSNLRPVADSVRAVLADATAAVIASTTAAIAATSSNG